MYVAEQYDDPGGTAGCHGRSHVAGRRCGPSGRSSLKSPARTHGPLFGNLARHDVLPGPSQYSQAPSSLPLPPPNQTCHKTNKKKRKKRKGTKIKGTFVRKANGK